MHDLGTENFDLKNWYESLITADRYKGTSSVRAEPESILPKKTRDVDEEAISDRARVIYSSAFRRLQQKTQVFTLSNDASVRTRLTHSLEVASTGRWIAQKVIDNYLRGKITPEHCFAFAFLVETACLAHDIGNPPFGHFGELAIQEWFGKNSWPHSDDTCQNEERHALIKDFLHFDGNPQGIRILTRLQGLIREDREKYGMDLTYSQVLTALKYPRAPQDGGEETWKKAGFFESERIKIEEAWEKLKFPRERRFPLAYLVEAADDISYCISDMEDAIDRGVLKPGEIFEEIERRFDHKVKHDKLDVGPDVAKLREHAEDFRKQISVNQSNVGKAKDLFFSFKASFGRRMIERAASLYGDGSDDGIRNGARKELFDCPKGRDAGALLTILKEIAQTFLYPADKVQTPFLAGRKIVHGILEEYSQLLELSPDVFRVVLDAYHSADRKQVKELKKETLLPLLDRLPLHYIDVYRASIQEKPNKYTLENWEWFSRAHLIVDYLAGMTDDFAYRTYQVISGARLE